MCSLDTYPFYSWDFDFSSFSCPPQLSPSNLFTLCISYKVLWASKPVDRQPCPCLFFISFFSDHSVSDLFSLRADLFPSLCCPVALPTEILTHWTVAQMISDFLLWYCIHREAKNSMHFSKAQPFPTPLEAPLYPDLHCSFWLNLPISIWCHATH